MLTFLRLPAMAREMLFGGEAKRGSELARAGFNHVLPRAEIWPRALEIARRFAEKPRRALTCLKRVLGESRRARMERARTVESLMHEVCFGDAEVLARLEESSAA